jgi:tetratricopeptide (TPR) repeat protein
MELVKGQPITQYCDDQRLTSRQRLELFVPVCQAVQHAHQKGIIHRDLKPSNVLVAPYDGRPVVKVIDFGVVKAAGQRLTDKTLFTEFGAIVGTLEYMSPEQAERNNQDVDTRSDIYSLGVLLYELLTGTTPLNRERLKEAALVEVLRIIREEEPPRPSVRLSESKDALPSLSAQRHMEPARLTRLVRGELDWIVMKALEKDRSRRYETANGLAVDVQRYLADGSVQACPPSGLYRFRKFARRHTRTLATVALLLVALAAGLIGTTVSLVRALAAEKLANQRLTEVRKANLQTTKALTETKRAQAKTDKALKESEEARQNAEAVSKYLVAAFRKPDPDQDGRNLKVVDVLDQSAQKLDKEFAGSPKIKAQLLNALGATYDDLGMPAQAVELLEQARALRQATLGVGHRDTLTSMADLAMAYEHVGKLAEAMALEEQTLKLRRSHLGRDDADTINSMSNLAATYQLVDRVADSIALCEEARLLDRVAHGSDRRAALSIANSLAVAYHREGRPEKALPLYEEAIEHLRAAFGLNYSGTLSVMSNLATAYADAGKLPEGIRTAEQVRDLKVAKFGRDHPATLETLHNLGSMYRDAGRLSEAITLYQQVCDGRIAKLGSDNPKTLLTFNNLATAYFDEGRVSEAIGTMKQARDGLLAKLGPDHPDTLNTVLNLAQFQDAAGDFEQSETLYRSVLERTRHRRPVDEIRLGNALSSYAFHLLTAGKPAEAEPLLRECLALRERTQPELWTTFNAKSMLGGSLLRQEKYAEAEPLLLQGYEGIERRLAQIQANGRNRFTEALERPCSSTKLWERRFSPSSGARSWETQRPLRKRLARPLGSQKAWHEP